MNDAPEYASHPGMPRSVRVETGVLRFSAAHFAVSGSGVAEPLHGHDYQVHVDIKGSLNHDNFVIDFHQLQAETLRILGPLEHKILLPERNSAVGFQREGTQMLVDGGGKRWSLPADDCLLLPVANTTTELLAEYLVKFILEEILDKSLCPGLQSIEVRLSESGGFSATAAISLD